MYIRDLAIKEITNKTLGADEFLYTLCLTYVTEAWCYLEMNEIKNAKLLLLDGKEILQPLFKTHVENLLTSNPAAYLHPSLKDQIDLKRFTKVYRWLNNDMDENKVFEKLRNNIFLIAEDRSDWIESLPPAIMPTGKTKFTQKLADGTRNMAKKFMSIIHFQKPNEEGSSEEPDVDIFALLPKTLLAIETMTEQFSRFENYISEIDTVIKLGLTFQEWRDLTPTDRTTDQAEKLYYIPVP